MVQTMMSSIFVSNKLIKMDPCKMVEAFIHLASFSSFQNKMVGLEGEEKFGTCKQKMGTPLRSIGYSHCSDKDNFFVPCCCASMPFDSLHVMPPASFQFKSVTNMASTTERIPSTSLEVVETNCI
jgi:hypothetical protein